MQNDKMRRIGGWLLAAAAIIYLGVRAYAFLQPGSDLTASQKITSFVFGMWLTKLLWPITFNGVRVDFQLLELLWIPWGAAVVVFLIWAGVKIGRGRFQRLLPPILFIIGMWILIALLIEKIKYGFGHGSEEILADLTGLIISIATGLIFLDTSKFLRAIKMKDQSLSTEEYQSATLQASGSTNQQISVQDEGLPNVNNGSPALIKRYKDAFKVAKVTVIIGTIIQIVGIVLSILIVGISIVAANEQRNEFFGIVGLIAGVFFCILFYFLGVLVKAQGQILRATLDTAVNSSPLLSNEQKAKVMFLH